MRFKHEIHFASKNVIGQIFPSRDQNKVKFTSLLNYSLSNPYEIDIAQVKELIAELNEVANQMSMLLLPVEEIDPLEKEKAKND